MFNSLFGLRADFIDEVNTCMDVIVLIIAIENEIWL
jgi:hypothetical protein